MANFYKSCIDLQNKFNPQFIMQAYEILRNFNFRAETPYFVPLFLYYYCCRYYYFARITNILKNIETSVEGPLVEIS